MANLSFHQRSRTAFLTLVSVLAFVPTILRASPEEFFRMGSFGGSYLGIEMEEVTAENMGTHKLTAERGVIVRSVEKGSPAEAGNLKPNDVILEYSGTPVWSTVQLARLVQETPEGRKVDLVISREGQKVNLSVKLGKREGPLSLTNRRFDFRTPGDEKHFRFEGPGGRMYRFEIPDGSGPFRFFDRGDLGESGGKPRVGIMLQPLTDQLGQHLGVPGKKGALITSVTPGSPAASAKLQAGDIIIRAGEIAIEDPDDLSRALRQKNAGEKLELKVIRDKKEITITLELPKEERKSSGFKM